MLFLLLAGSILAAVPSVDTTMAVRSGDAVVVEGIAGSVRVRAWGREELSLGGRGDRARDVEVVRSGNRLRIAARDRKGRGLDVDVELALPPWVDLEIRGRELDVWVEGMQSHLRVHTVEGDIEATDLAGVIELTSVEGRIDIDGARGSVTARSRGDDVAATGVAGELVVETGSGDVRLERITASVVHAQTLDGDLRYEGALNRGGSYTFTVHDGDADIEIPEGSGAVARVATFDGEFTSDFPVTLQGYGGKGVFDFTLGAGGASLTIEVFDGEIRLRSGRR